MYEMFMNIPVGTFFKVAEDIVDSSIVFQKITPYLVEDKEGYETVAINAVEQIGANVGDTWLIEDDCKVIAMTNTCIRFDD